MGGALDIHTGDLVTAAGVQQRDALHALAIRNDTTNAMYTDNKVGALLIAILLAVAACVGFYLSTGGPLRSWGCCCWESPHGTC